MVDRDLNVNDANQRIANPYRSPCGINLSEKNNASEEEADLEL